MIDLATLGNQVKILIIDHQTLAQNFLKSSLEKLGFRNLYFAEHAQAAMNLCKEFHFELILCSFNLRQGKDGYQLYEEMKVSGIVQSSTGFIFISAETEAPLVHSVVELQPDDFLVKPFTPRDLEIRITRVLLQKMEIKALYEMMDAGKFEEALKHIERFLKEPDKTRYSHLLLRKKGEILLMIKDYERAQGYFRALIKVQPLPWAQLGLAKALIELGQYEESADHLEELIERPETKLKATELLSEAYYGCHEFESAQEHLEKAVTLAPRNIGRQTQLMNLSRINHDYAIQYKTSKDILNLTRHSTHHTPEVYLNAARAAIDFCLMDAPDEEEFHRIIKQSNEYLQQVNTQFPQEDKHSQVKVIEARICYLKNENDLGTRLLKDIREEEFTGENVNDDLDKAKAFHELGFINESRNLYQEISEHYGNQEENQVLNTLIRQEVKERTEITKGPRELNNDAVKCFSQGRVDEAYTHFKQAFHFMPKNASIALNLLQTMFDNRFQHMIDDNDIALIERCRNIVETADLTGEQDDRWKVLKDKIDEI